MAIREVSIDSLNLGIWTFLFITQLRVYRFNPLLGVLGGIVGIAFTYVLTRKQLKGIEKNGEWKSTRRDIFFVMLAIIVLVLGIYLVVIGPLAIQYQSESFLGIMLLSMLAFSVFRVLSWERRHKKQIYVEGAWHGRMIAVEVRKRLPPPPPPPPDL